MSIYFGSDTVSNLYIGLTPVSKGYVGTYLFYDGDSTIIDFTYEKYILNTQFSTLYNTKELPVKSAVLKGNTLVNLFVKTGITTSNPPYLSIKGNMTQIKASTKYTIKYFNLPTEKIKQLRVVERHSSDTIHGIPVSGIGTFTTNSDISNFKSLTVQVIETTSGSISEEELSEVKILLMEGDYTNVDIPYFEGIGSVKMPVLKTTGKNIVGNLEMGGIDANGKDNNLTIYTRSGFILLKKDTTYTFSLNKVKRSYHLYLYDLNKNFKEKVGMANEYTPEVDCYIRIFQMDEIDKALYQVEEGSVATEYEPYKSTTVTCNEEVELRGIGDVKDELDLLTGELIQRVGKVVLNGGESWVRSGYSTTDYPAFYIEIKDSVNALSSTNFICDGFVAAKVTTNRDMEGAIMNKNDINSSGGSNFFVRISSSKLSTSDVAGFIEYLGSNPITLYYTLNTELVSSANITTKDQAGNDTKLSSFEDITHVTVTYEGLIPGVELEVATKNEEVLNTMSLEMDDISTTQTSLEETSDAQSENVDVTMMATTEIYEQLL